MALIPYTRAQNIRSHLLKWTEVTDGDTCNPFKIDGQDAALGSIQVTGAFGGATVTLQASIDGTNYVTVNDVSGDAVSFTAAGLAEFSVTALHIKPVITGGSESDVDISVLLRG